MIKFRKMGIIMGPQKDRLGSFARFNPGVILKDGFVHMLYRATDNDIKDCNNYISHIGYAKLDLNTNILHDSNKKVIFPTMEEESKGCEDPRIVEFEGTNYVFYTAYDGVKARVAIAQTDDFIKYKKLGTINNVMWDKDGFIFPRRINGKIAYLHRVEPNIQLDYFDDFKQLISEKAWENYENKVESSTIMRGNLGWENRKIGGSMPPIEVKEGWLLLYHAVDDKLIYRGSVALLDLDNPSKIIARIPYPMIEPEEQYELIGDVNNVVFPQGGYIFNNELFIYYGSADKYIALAKVGMKDLMKELSKYQMAD